MAATTSLLAAARRQENAKQSVELIESLLDSDLVFPVTLTYADKEAIFTKSDFEGPKVFEFVKKAANRLALENICFFATDGAKKSVSNTKKDMTRLLVYCLINGQKMELFTCDD
uniref:General transcription factor II-I repeat domain-containing protein 2 n=1 Tax=Globodera pallida TaxID=36090 RepID=A0A183BWL4_GLOPA